MIGSATRYLIQGNVLGYVTKYEGYSICDPFLPSFRSFNGSLPCRPATVPLIQGGVRCEGFTPLGINIGKCLWSGKVPTEQMDGSPSE